MLHIEDSVLAWYEDLVVNPTPTRIAMARLILEGVIHHANTGRITIASSPGLAAAMVYSDPAYIPPGMNSAQLDVLHWCSERQVNQYGRSLRVFSRRLPTPSETRNTLLKRINFLCTRRPNGDLDIRFCFPRL